MQTQTKLLTFQTVRSSDHERDWPRFVMIAWSSVRSGFAFSHVMYFFHNSTCKTIQQEQALMYVSVYMIDIITVFVLRINSAINDRNKLF